MTYEEQNDTKTIYYEKQDGWSKSEFYYLHRYLHRLLYYYKKHEQEIRSLDLKRMTEETRVLIYCIIKYYNYDFMFQDYANLVGLETTKPLEHLLIIDDSTLQEDDVYKRMNVVY